MAGASRRRSRARYSTWTPAPPYTSGGYSRLSKATRLGPRWFSGSADAIYQSLNLVYYEQPDYILVFGADHIYRMDPKQMLDAHIASGASATVAGIHAPLREANQFGVIKTAADGKAI